MNRSIEKTLLKGTILLLLFSLFLEIGPNSILNYLEFVLIWYILLFIYIRIKLSNRYVAGEESIQTFNMFGGKTLKYDAINLVFVRVGFLQKRFGLSTVFIISTRFNVLIRDVENGQNIADKINKKLNELRPPENKV